MRRRAFFGDLDAVRGEKPGHGLAQRFIRQLGLFRLGLLREYRGRV
jgi:hypothetical protein